MTAREYLSQMYRINEQIKEMQEEIAHLRALSEKATAAYGSAPSGGSQGGRENIIVKSMELEKAVLDGIMRILELRHTVIESISKVRQTECRMVLEKRYLHYKRWEQIAVDLNYSIDHIFYLHRKALRIIALFLPLN